MIDESRTADLHAAPLAADFLPALLPPGFYVVHSRRVEILSRFGRRVLHLECEVIEPPKYDGVRLT